jgi:hypothetical protein
VGIFLCFFIGIVLHFMTCKCYAFFMRTNSFIMNIDFLIVWGGSTVAYFKVLSYHLLQKISSLPVEILVKGARVQSTMLLYLVFMCVYAIHLSLTCVEDSWTLCRHGPGFDQSSPQPAVPHPPLSLSSVQTSVAMGLISQRGLSLPENSIHTYQYS